MKIFNFIFKLFKITLSVEENLIKEIITLMCLNDTTVILYSPIEDIYLLKLRIKWPLKRYQTFCVEAKTPAPYCQSLKASIKKIYYFIEEE